MNIKKIISLRSLIIIAICFRLGWFFYILSVSQNGFFLADSVGYCQLAENLLNGDPYSMSSEEPFYPDVFRTPLLPGLLVITGNTVSLFILLQILLSVLTVAITYRLTLKISGNEKVAFLSGLIVAADIPSVVMANMIMAETTYTLLMLAGIYLMLKWKESDHLKFLLVSSCCLGLAALARPIGIFLPFFLLPVLLYINHHKKHGLLKGIPTFLLPFAVLAGSWMIRNYFVFGSFFFSHISSFNLAFFSAGTIRAQTEKISITEARTQLYNEAYEGMEATPYDDPAVFYPRLRNVCVKEITKHPGLFLTNAAKANFRLFFYPMSGFINQVQTGMDPREAWKVKKLYPVTQTLVGLQIAGILFYSLGIAISFFLFLRKKINPFIFFLFVWILLYFSFTGFGPEMEARFRIPAMPYIAVLAALGWGVFLMRNRVIEG